MNILSTLFKGLSNMSKAVEAIFNKKSNELEVAYNFKHSK
jgi:hypothetical protein